MKNIGLFVILVATLMSVSEGAIPFTERTCASSQTAEVSSLDTQVFSSVKVDGLNFRSVKLRGTLLLLR